MGAFSYEPGNKEQKTKGLGCGKEGGRDPTTGPRHSRLLHSALIPEERWPWDHRSARPFSSFSLYWAVVSRGRLAFSPYSASLQSNCLFPRRLSKKDDIHQSLPSGDFGGRERGRCLSVEAGKEKEENLEGRKGFQASELLQQSWGDDSHSLLSCTSSSAHSHWRSLFPAQTLD